MMTRNQATVRQSKLLANEILLSIFSYHRLPSAQTIGRERYEDINIPKGPIVHNGPIKSYSDNDLNTGACTRQHDEWKLRLRTLSAITKASRRFRELALPLLYQVYPGQTLVKPQVFLRTLKHQPQFAMLVEEAVLDPWASLEQSKEYISEFKTLMLRSPGFSTVDCLEKHAKVWNDEASAALLLFNCHNIHSLDLTCPSAGFFDDAPICALFKQLRVLGPNTLARNNEEAEDPRNILTALPLRKVKNLFLHHAEHCYIRNMKPLAPLMRLHTVRSVTAYRFWDGVEAIQNLGHIHELTLSRCLLKPTTLLKGLECCRDLRSLSIVFAGFKATLRRLIAEQDHVDYFELGNTIRTKLTKLRKLALDDREYEVLLPRQLGSFREGPALEELAVGEGCLGCYEVVGEADVATAQLADMLPPTLRSLAIFRTNRWWHESDKREESIPMENETATYRFDAMRKRVVEMLRHGQAKVPELVAIHIDTPKKFSSDVESFGWRSEQVVGDEVLARPSLVADSLMEPDEKRSWEMTQDYTAAKPSVLLRKV